MRRSEGDPAALARQVRQILVRAGFELVDEADARTPGLRVLPTDSGARIAWTASDDSPR